MPGKLSASVKHHISNFYPLHANGPVCDDDRYTLGEKDMKVIGDLHIVVFAASYQCDRSSQV